MTAVCVDFLINTAQVYDFLCVKTEHPSHFLFLIMRKNQSKLIMFGHSPIIITAVDCTVERVHKICDRLLNMLGLPIINGRSQINRTVQ